jgi:hypothetical protein
MAIFFNSFKVFLAFKIKGDSIPSGGPCDPTPTNALIGKNPFWFFMIMNFKLNSCPTMSGGFLCCFKVHDFFFLGFFCWSLVTYLPTYPLVRTYQPTSFTRCTIYCHNILHVILFNYLVQYPHSTMAITIFNSVIIPSW